MRCPSCNSSSSWENVDRFRYKKEDMAICKTCGFISYPEKYKSKQEIIDYYDKDYRNAPNVQSFFTGVRKLHYHAAFLETMLKEWYERKLTSPVITEIGAAYGLFLHWFRTLSFQGKPMFDDKIDVSGTELTKSFVRNAWHEFGIKLGKDFDETKSYDLIASYKCLEHMLDPDLELKRYHKALKTDGYLYISVPIWFEELNNFGMTGWTLEYYYSPDHVNAWSKSIFEFILKNAGFTIVQENHSIYDSTYLCKKASVEEHLKVPAEYEKNKENLERILKADEAFQKQLYETAADLWPRFPVARRAAYEIKRAEWDKKGWDKIKAEVIDPWTTLDPLSFDAFLFGADLSTRYAKYDLAIEYFEACLKLRPCDEGAMTSLSNIYRVTSKSCHDDKKRMELRMKARNISYKIKELFPSSLQTAITWIYNDNAIIPTPWE